MVSSMRKIDLVFRTVGERTSDIALELAIQNINPNRVHLIEQVRPFSKAVDMMLQIQYDCDFVVFMDADCLIMEDMRPFLEQNQYCYVDCFVLDKFRGQIHQGVHITRLDLVRQMQQVPAPQGDEKYVLRPESRLRSIALRRLKEHKHFKHFRIFHDFFQSYEHIFAKFGLRELRSRTPENYRQLEAARSYWATQPQDPDFQVANYAIDFTRKHVPYDATPEDLAGYIADLYNLADQQVPCLNLPTQLSLTRAEVDAKSRKQWQWQLLKLSSHQRLDDRSSLVDEGTSQPFQLYATPSPDKRTTAREQLEGIQPKVFGIGLSRTGTKSLTSALKVLGITTIHYPDDETTLRELISGNYKFSLLQQFDGITDITVAPFYRQLDRTFPGSKFILTMRHKEDWLRSLENHWQGRPAFVDWDSDMETLGMKSPHELETHMHIRRLLRAATYGCYEFSYDRISDVYDEHYDRVKRYFEHRPGDLLIMDICSGDGWEKLCPFLNKPLVEFPFPFVKKQSALKALLAS